MMVQNARKKLPPERRQFLFCGDCEILAFVLYYTYDYGRRKVWDFIGKPPV